MAVADTAKLVASLELVDKFSRPIGNIERSMGRLERRSSILSRGLGTALGIGIAAASRATVGLGKSVVTTAISFEEAFAGVRKTVDATDAELDALHQSFRDTAKETGIAFEELARIGQIAGALGVDTSGIDEFALAIAKASTATELSVDELADSVGRIGNILSLDQSTYETFLSTLVELGNKGASTEAEILEITKRFAATGKQAGLSTDEILGLSSAIAALGAEPEAAGSALSRLMSNFITETANGSAKAKVFAKVAGTSFKDFADIVETDTLGAILKFIGGLDELSKFERFQALEEAGITNVRDRQAVLAFAGSIEEVNRQLGISQEEFGKTDALTEEFRKRQETTAVQLKILKENLRDIGNTIGSVVLPKITALSKEFVEFLGTPDAQKAIKEFAAGLPGLVDDLVGIAKGIPWAAIGSAAQLMGTGAKALLQAFTSLPPWVQTAVLTGWGLNKISGGLLGSLGKNLLGGAIGGLRGSSPATPVFTREVGLGGAGGAPVAAGGSRLATAAKFILGPAAAVLIGNQIGQAITEGMVAPARDFETGVLEAVLASGDAGRIERAIRVIEDQLNPEDFAAQTALALDINGVRTTLEGQKAALEAALTEQGLTRDQARSIGERQSRIAEGARNDANRYASQLNATVAAARAQANQKAAEQVAAIRGTAANTATQLERIRSVESATAGNTARIAAKDFSPTFQAFTSINLQAQISAYGISRTLQVVQSASQTSFSGKGGDSRF